MRHHLLSPRHTCWELDQNLSSQDSNLNSNMGCGHPELQLNLYTTTQAPLLNKKAKIKILE